MTKSVFLLLEIRVDNLLIATLYIPNNSLRNLIDSSSIAFFIDYVLVAIILYIKFTHSEDMFL